MGPYMGDSQNGGTQQPWVFLLKWSFWGVLGVPPFKETPIYTPGNHVGIYWARSISTFHCEILLMATRTPANSPVEVDRKYPIFGWGFSTIQTVGFLAGFLNHQQYY